MKILIVFGLLVLMFRLKWHIGLAMVAAALLLGVLFSMPAREMAITFIQTAVSFSTLELVAVLILIMFLENILRKNGFLARMLAALKVLAREPRLVLAFLPAFIGLLPSAGGAYFSAPMVEDAARGTNMSPSQASFTNYWFRHVWELFSPLYPAIVLAMGTGRVSYPQVLAFQGPLAVLAVIVGIPLAFKGFQMLPHAAAAEPPGVSLKTVVSRGRLWADLLSGMAPVVVVVIMAVGFRLDLAGVLAVVVATMLIICRYNFRRLLELVKEALSFKTVLMVLGVCVFKDMLAASGAVDQLPRAFALLHLPRRLIFFVLPFAVGVLTGYSPGYIGATFPILVSLLPGNSPHAAMMAFAYASGFAGTMLSPAHLCAILTVQHFHASYGSLWKRVVVAIAALVGLSLGLSFMFG